MRNKKAKAIRKQVYGDYSHRLRKYIQLKSGQIINVGLRAKYKIAKKIERR